MKYRVMSSLLVFMASITNLMAGPLKVDPKNSIISVVIEKTGPLSSIIGHNHLIYASKIQSVLDVSSRENPVGSRFEVFFQVADLVNDEVSVSKKFQPRLKELGLLSGELSPIEQEDREKIRKTMLSSAQLDASSFPEIGGLLTIESIDPNKEPHLYVGRLSLTIKGVRVEKELLVYWKPVSNNGIEVELYSRYEFTEFGITPFETLGGGLGNKNLFSLYSKIYLM